MTHTIYENRTLSFENTIIYALKHPFWMIYDIFYQLFNAWHRSCLYVGKETKKEPAMKSKKTKAYKTEESGYNADENVLAMYLREIGRASLLF